MDLNEKINSIRKLIDEADAVVIGAGAGLSTAAGIDYGGKRFEENFADYMKEYGLTDMYSSAFYNFNTPEERWAYFSRHIMLNRYQVGKTEVYTSLLDLVKDKEYFVLTTNADCQFYINDFEDERIFAMQGDYSKFQCSEGCHDTLYDNYDIVEKMVENFSDFRVPAELIPVCPKCGEPMDANLHKDQYFVRDYKWHQQNRKYNDFIKKYENSRILFIEIGVGYNTPGIIKYPFWRMTLDFEQANYVCLNKSEAYIPQEIKEKSIGINGDFKEIIESI